MTAIYAGVSAEEKKTESISATKLDWQQKKEEQAKLRKRQNDLAKTESRIQELEERDSEIDTLMSQEEIFTNVSECLKLCTEIAAISEELVNLYIKGVELAD